MNEKIEEKIMNKKEIINNQPLNESNNMILRKNENLQGHNYVCSDIHGMYKSYEKIYEEISINDTLWILGDVTDRGKYGILILQDIIKKQLNNNVPKVNYILGNHDYFLIYMLDLMKENDLSSDDIKNVFYLLVNDSNIMFYQEELENIDANKEEIEKDLENSIKLKKKLEEKVEKLMTNGKLTFAIKRFIKFWGISNSGNYTLNDLLKLSIAEQNEIYNFLTNSLVFLSMKVENVNIALTHSAPPLLKNEDEINSLYMNYTYNDMKKIHDGDYIIDFLQMRDKYIDELIENKKIELINKSEYNELSFEKICLEFDPYVQWKEKGFITICGHTPNREGKEIINVQRKYIRIDGGCADGGNLILYNIEENKFKYIECKE